MTEHTVGRSALRASAWSVTAALLILAFDVALARAQSAEQVRQSRAASEAMEKGRFDEAAGIYRALLQSLPDDAGLLMNLGMALAMSGHESDAIAPLERAV